MRVFTTIAGLRCYVALKRSEPPLEDAIDQPGLHPVGVKVGFVPTMGALHAGHLNLIERSRRENDVVIVSIFVNPLQFGPNEDFQQYPRPIEQDTQLCEQAGVDAIFSPSPEELYGSPYPPVSDRVTQVIPPFQMMSGLCGRSRPGHFQGVATVVTKLLNIVQPDRAYFGRKDAQQLAILRRLVADLNIPVDIVACRIVREPNGLAMSSRNRYLTSDQYDKAAVLYRSLQRAESIFQLGKHYREALVQAVETELATVPDVQPEYIELVHPDTMMPLEQIEDVGLLAIAARMGSTRLIDNMVLRNRKPIVAIDGPAGVGKTTVVRQVATELGLLHIDTGAMYRAATWLALQSGLAIDDEAAIAEMVSQCQIELGSQKTEDANSQSPQVHINGHNVTTAIRSLDVTQQVSAIAAQPAVRKILVKQQQAYGRGGGVAMEGRDIGTHVFPDAELKIFLTASVQERARRRQIDLKNQGQAEVDLGELERLIDERDRKDSTRQVSPLQKAPDAIEINTDRLSIAEVTATIVGLYQERLSEVHSHR
ncbi:bifunctional pantoate--beta-alanine ligase/(d)CMP kinase [Oculatella sp. LEGE 06141]|uniref:bifunctional pantoate--beta-alanine ligase/(d)CMP kinase n=1 Tax=Oculatella sp. LEGE 06141 TaxID=1828648 RepID=UPI0018810099|nr:bifunctional pantoate--beta-alanine ligase/(d)CMP kinase [Oculatella sp. LEGE 06141]